MGVTYDGKKLIPAPFLAITREANILEDGKKLDWTYQLTLTGKFLVDKGIPHIHRRLAHSHGLSGRRSDAANSRFSSILANVR